MKEELEAIIQEKMDEINPNLTDLYVSHEEEVQDVVQKQNQAVEEEKKRRIYLSLLEEAKENGLDIPFDESMTTQELEDLARNIEV